MLGSYAKAEIDHLAEMPSAVAAETKWLAKGDDVRFMSDVAMRMRDER